MRHPACGSLFHEALHHRCLGIGLEDARAVVAMPGKLTVHHVGKGTRWVQPAAGEQTKVGIVGAGFHKPYDVAIQRVLGEGPSQADGRCDDVVYKTLLGIQALNMSERSFTKWANLELETVK